MTVQQVHWYLDLFDALGITVWIDGGWGVDALLGKQTRSHQDLDILLLASDSVRLVEVLTQRGFRDIETDDRCDENFVMGHAIHGRIDFHVIELTPDGGAVYLARGAHWVFTPPELSAAGSIGGIPVRCPSAEYQVRSHSGYTLHESDYADMEALHRVLGVSLLKEQRRRKIVQ